MSVRWTFLSYEKLLLILLRAETNSKQKEKGTLPRRNEPRHTLEEEGYIILTLFASHLVGVECTGTRDGDEGVVRGLASEGEQGEEEEEEDGRAVEERQGKRREASGGGGGGEGEGR